MKKNFKIIATLFIGILIGLGISDNSFSEKGIYAVKSNFKVLIDSKPVRINAYEINDKPYISLYELDNIILPIDFEANYKNKTYNIIPSTYIAFKDFNDKKYVDLEYYCARYQEPSPPPIKDKEGMLIAPPLDRYDYLYFFNLKEDPDTKLVEDLILNIKDNKNNRIYKGNLKLINTSTYPRIIMDYEEFKKNSNLFINMIYENEKIFDK